MSGFPRLFLEISLYMGDKILVKLGSYRTWFSISNHLIVDLNDWKDALDRTGEKSFLRLFYFRDMHIPFLYLIAFPRQIEDLLPRNAEENLVAGSHHALVVEDQEKIGAHRFSDPFSVLHEKQVVESPPFEFGNETNAGDIVGGLDLRNFTQEIMGHQFDPMGRLPGLCR